MGWKDEAEFADLKKWSKHFDADFRARCKNKGLAPVQKGGNCPLDPIETRLHQALQGPKKTIMEIGCGPGFLGLALLHAGHDYHGIDISEEAIYFCKKHLGGVNADRFTALAVEKTAEIKKRYQVVIADNLLGYVQSPLEALKKIWELVDEDGVLLLTTPIQRRIGIDESQIHEWSEEYFIHLVREQLGGYHLSIRNLDGVFLLMQITRKPVECRYLMLLSNQQDVDQAQETMNSGRQMKTGYWNWYKAMQGEVDHYRSKKVHPEDFDVIHIQLSGCNMDGVRFLHEHKPSHTKLVAQIDYSFETWNNLAQNQEAVWSTLDLADHILAVEPYGAALLSEKLGRKVHLLPHPMQVENIRAIQVPVEQRWGVVVHAHRDWDWFTPLWALKNQLEPVFLGGYLGPPVADGFVAVVTLHYDNVWKILESGDYVRSTAQRKFAYDSYRHHVFGRTIAEGAAIGVPTIGYENSWAMKLFFPDLVVPLGDVIEARVRVDQLQDPDEYRRIAEFGLREVQKIDYANSKRQMVQLAQGGETDWQYDRSGRIWHYVHS